MVEQKFINWAKEKLNDVIDVLKDDYGDQSEVFKLHTRNGNYFLKVGLGLEKELKRLEWLQGKLPVPKIIGFSNTANKDALLLSAIEGKNLAALSKEWPAEKVVGELTETLHQFHAIDVKNCPFGTYEEGKVLIHGDACLPNFIFQDNNFSGYIDLGGGDGCQPRNRFFCDHLELTIQPWPGIWCNVFEKVWSKKCD